MEGCQKNLSRFSRNFLLLAYCDFTKNICCTFDKKPWKWVWFKCFIFQAVSFAVHSWCTNKVLQEMIHPRRIPNTQNFCCLESWLANQLIHSRNRRKKGLFNTFLVFTLFENYSKCRIWILVFSTNFCPIKTDLSGNTVWPQASGFQKIAKMDHFWHF